MLKSLLRLLIMSLCTTSVVAEAKVVTATPATLVSLFKSVSAGDTLVLVGTFGTTKLENRSFATTLKIDASKANFTDSLVIRNVSGISITGGTYGSSTTATSWGRAIAFYDATNVAIDGAKFIGAKTGTGISFIRGTNVSVSNSSFTGLKSGVSMGTVTGGLILANKSLNAASDGFDIADSHKVTVKGNSCSGSVPSSGAHPDCVQLWSIAGHPVQSDITITDNTATGATQGFTSFNASAGGGLRITMTNNRANVTFSQGIACYACRDSVITGNVLTTAAGAKYQTRVSVIGGSNNLVANNIDGLKPNAKATALAVAAKTTTSDFLTYAPVSRTAALPGSPQSVSAVPEPASWLMITLGFGFAGAMLRRRQRNIVAA